ncbi:MAG: methyltransferase domain-containing protein [Alphaproteobacteria bacterium]|nr:methyltransferase domain-containing protein [Alphaproteobacteria bacterium]
MTSQQIKATYDRATRLTQSGKSKQAEELWRKLIDIDPRNAVFWNGLGVVFESQEKREQALESYMTATSCKPLWEACLNAGRLSVVLGKHEAAVQFLSQAIDIDDSRPQGWKELAVAYFAMRKYEHAILLLNKAVEMDPDSKDVYSGYLSFIFREYFPVKHSEHFERAMLNCLSIENNDFERLSKAWHETIFINPAINPVIRAERETLYAAINFGATIPGIDSPLLTEGIRKIICAEPELERFLTTCRHICLEMSSKNNLPKRIPELLFSLSHQCHNNEYVFYATEEEASTVERLTENLSLKSPEELKCELFKIVTLSCYRPLHSFSESLRSRIVTLSGDAELAKLGSIVKDQIVEPAQELEIKETIRSLGTISNSVSEKVREQYEENPYPRWRQAFGTTPEIRFKCLPSGHRHAIKNILVAGCGTGKQVCILRTYFPDAQITSVDLSRTSIAYAIRQIRDMGLNKNMEFYHADILELGDVLRGTYDYIGCTGVLHHMENPLKGWRILASLLAPEGVMNIGLYSETARQHIVKARDYIAKMGFGTSPRDIRECRNRIMRMPKDHPISKVRSSSDFYSLSTCRDLIFHAHEQRYTISRIQDELDALDLTFRGFAWQTRKQELEYQEMFPEDREMLDLENWKEFERRNPDTFASMYQFWCTKKSERT